MARTEGVSEPIAIELWFASEAALRAFAEEVGACAAGGEIFALAGTLGAGKTTFTQSFARGLGVPQSMPVTSPTFVLHRRYAGRLTLEHLDAYRLAGAADFEALGIGEILEGSGVAVVEWADRVKEVFPSRAVWIELDVTGPCSRRMRLRIPSQAGFPALARLRALCEARAAREAR